MVGRLDSERERGRREMPRPGVAVYQGQTWQQYHLKHEPL